MLIEPTHKNQFTDTRQLLTVFTDHPFAVVRQANADADEGTGVAPPSSRSRRAARMRRRARHGNAGWRSGIGVV